MTDYAICFDSSRCTACKGCQVACKCWNQLPSPLGLNANEPTHSYQSPKDLNGDTRLIITFEENDNNRRWGVDWSFGRRSCMHCYNPACVRVCPSGALSVDPGTGFVGVDEARCIGCRFCSSACPFDVPRYHGPEGKVNKCTACLDRIRNGFKPTINGSGRTCENAQFDTPACVHTCPPGALRFGPRDEMLELAHKRVEWLRNHPINPCPDASVYGEDELEGTHVIMVLKYPVQTYGLPADPHVNPLTDVVPIMKPLVGVAAGATVLGLAATFVSGIGYKRDTLRYDPKTRETIDTDTGQVVKRGDGQVVGQGDDTEGEGRS